MGLCRERVEPRGRTHPICDLVLLGLVEVIHAFTGTQMSFLNVLNTMILNKFYWVFLTITLLFSVRLILFRLRDRDTTS